MPEFGDLKPDEVALRGTWEAVGTRVEADGICGRIEWLTTTRLERLGTDSSGWATLYRDPLDGRLWELTYPRSELHGGGPPALEAVATDVANERYGVGTG